jgi:hypothetical protein
MRPALALLLVSCAAGAVACTLLTPLDDLESGSGAASPAAVGTTGSSTSGVSGSSGSAGGGDGGGTGTATSTATGVGGSGGAPGATYAEVILADGPVAYWRLGDADGTAVEEVNGLDGTYLGPVTHGVPGAIASDGDAASDFDFDGTHLQARVQCPPDLDFAGASPFSLEAWVKPRFVDGDHRRIFDKSQAAMQGYQLHFGGATHGITFYRYRDGIANYLTYNNNDMSSALTLDQYTHVVATYDGTAMRLFLNGSEKVSVVPPALDLLDTTIPLMIGSPPNGNFSFPGAIDEAAIYDIALTAAQVAAHYAAGLAL